MSLSVLLGSSRGLGLSLARSHLTRSSLPLVCASRTPDEARERILEGLPRDMGKRLTTLHIDLTKEKSIEELAAKVKEMGDVRSLWNVAGMLSVEKNLSQVSYEDMLAQFQLNTFAPLLAMKHFAPLLPKQINASGSGGVSAQAAGDRKPGKPDGVGETSGGDPAEGVAPKGLALIASLSARVGSIGDNKKGGWYSYRASKAAQNAITKTLSHELRLKGVPAIAVALHPGTVRTELSAPFTGGPGGKEGREKPRGEFEADESAELLYDVVRKLRAEDSGAFRDWEGKEIVW